MGLLLFWVSFLLHQVLRIAFCWYKPIYFISKYGFKRGLKKLNWHYIHQALAEDQSANVSLYILLNKFFTKGQHDYHFGDEDDTISYATSMSYWKGTPGGPATFLRNFLCWVDTNHDVKSITGKIERDFEGLRRLQDAGLVTVRTEVAIDENSWMLYVQSVTNKERIITL